MIDRILNRTIVPLVFASLLCVAIADAASPVVTVTVDSSATVEGKHLITIGDIAHVTGGVPATRRRVSDLDIDTLDSQESDGVRPVLGISKRQLEMRLILAGLKRHQFMVISPEQVRFEPNREVSVQDEVESLLGQEIARQFGILPADVTTQLTNTQQIQSVNRKLNGSRFSIQVVTQNQLPLGNTKLQLEFSSANGNRFIENLDTRIVVSMEVALATHVIERGTVIQVDMFRMIKRPVMDRSEYASATQLVGRVATRRIPRNEVMLANHLSSQLRSNQWDVKTNDLIDVVMMINGSQIRLTNAKALSSANRGETVTVLNTRSNKRLNARVVEKNLAEIRLHGARQPGGLRR